MRASALFALLFVLAPLDSSAQDHRAIIDTQFDSATVAAREQGFRPSTGVISQEGITGLLPASGNVFLEVNLRAGVEYMVVGACDYDCSDLDLAAHTAGGEQIASDIELDDVPVVSFRPATSGTYLIEVSLPGCEADTCYFGVRIYND